MRQIKGEEIIRQIRFKSFGNSKGKDEIILTNKRIILKTVSKNKATRTTEKHIDVKTIAGISIASERHFNFKAFFTLMIVPLLGVGYAVWRTYFSTATFINNLFIYSITGFLVIAIIGVLIFKRAYVGVGVMLKAVADPTEEGALLELTGRAYRDKKETISILVQEVMTLATGGSIPKKVKTEVTEEPIVKVEK